MNNHGAKPNWVRRKFIGKGSFGMVTLAVDESNDGFPFAVKSVDKNSGALLQCLENEIRILKSLSSPYVVTYIGDDITCESSTVYRNLHLEYLPNGKVAGIGKLPSSLSDQSHLRGYIRCIVSALSHIHARNIVHCDVKGANVLIGNIPGTAKLADFGSAVELPVLKPGLRGSPQWMAPEVVRCEYVGPESDVWSLGCTLIEMLTGKPPWKDRGINTLRQIGYSDDLPELEIPVPDDLREFLSKCLKREKSERWSCDQLLHHPFLLSCSVPSSMEITINTCQLSPRCVIDWSDSGSSDESTVEVYQFNGNRSTVEQRIGKLASNSRVDWGSEGWETVRHVVTGGEDSPECCESGEEEVVSVSGMENGEDTESVVGYDYDMRGTSGNAWSTMVGGMYHSDSVDMYRCDMFVWIEKLVQILFLMNLNVIRHILYTRWLTLTPSIY